jgi:uncharacterized membrane protein YukC
MGELIPLREEERDKIYSQFSGGEPPMDTHFEKYLDIRFGHIEGNIRAIRSDIKDQTKKIEDQSKKIDNMKYWFLGTALGLLTLLFTVVGYYTWTMQNQFNYHQASIQAQMQSFTDYVKAVTQPQMPKPPTPSK